MILVAILQQAVAAPAPIALGNVQMTCTIAAPSAPPATFAVDLQTKKPGSAALVGDADGPWGRVSATSDTIAGAGGTAAFTLANGVAQYRLELSFTGAPDAGLAKARLIALGQPGGAARYGQGFCTARAGRRLAPKDLVRLPFDGTPVFAPIGRAQLQPVPAGLTSGSCRLVAPDRRMQTVSFTVTAAHDNEASVAYRFDNADLIGTPTAAATGVRFHLALGSDHVVAMTQALPTAPTIYVQTDFERSGTWIELTRAGQTLAWGECGATPAAIVAPPPGKPQP